MWGWGRRLKRRFYRVEGLISGKKLGKLTKSSPQCPSRRLESVVLSGQQPDDQQTKHHHDHAEKTNLPFLQNEHLLKETAPTPRRDHGQQPLQNEHEAQCQQEGVKQVLLPNRRAIGSAAHTLEEL